jgi:predicted metal-dependent phosphoesterase TrpH
MTAPPSVLRADLHVHTMHSRVNNDLAFLRSRDCYSRPADVYRVAKARGMDLVAITDHDSIDGCLELLDARPDAADLIVGEEISCRIPASNIEAHVAAYGMTEALHRDVQRLRGNVFDVIARLREAGVFFALNHLFHFYRGQVPLPEYLRLLEEIPALEARNGTMLRAHNELVERLLTGRGSEAEGRSGRRRFAAVAGSDAHTLRRVGRTWTEAPGRNRDEFLASVAAGLGRPGGAHGSAPTVACEAYGVIKSFAASLVGIGPSDHAPLHRALCLTFILLSLPFEFLPLAVATAGKHQEQRFVREAAEMLPAWLDGHSHGHSALEQVGGRA